MKKKYLLFAAAIFCVLICVAFVSLSSRFQITYNEIKMNVKNVSATEGQSLMLPSDFFEQIGVSAEINFESGEARFSKGETELQTEAGSSSVTFNDEQEELILPPTIKDGVFYLPAELLWLFGFDYETDAYRYLHVTDMPEEKFKDLTVKVMDYMMAGNFQAVYELCTPEFQTENPPESIQDEFEFALERPGDYEGFYDYEEVYMLNREGKVICEGSLRSDYSNGSLLLRFDYEHGGLMNRQRMTPGDFLIPQTIREEDVTVGEGTAHPLGGTLTLPEGDGPFKVVLLLPGSGVVDRDQDIYYTLKPFRDIAWGLAENGVASLRFDKRIYAYEQEYELNPELTINDELIEDALLAAELLRADGRFAGFYVAGNSLGAMFAPVIHAQGGNFDGIITLAGTARNLWELGKTQKLYYAEHGYADEPERAALYQAEYDGLIALGNISLIDDALAKTMLLGDKYLYYYKDSLSYDLVEAVKQAGVPFLVLQGTADFQIYEDIDYKLYKEILAGNPQAEFKLYDNLNHFFVESPEEHKGTPEEYQVRKGQVPAYVSEDIAQFILEN